VVVVVEEEEQQKKKKQEEEDEETATAVNQLKTNKWTIPEECMQELPSVVRGMNLMEEMERRRRGVHFIENMMSYFTFEKVIQGETLDETKAPRVFPTAVHMFHRFYTFHPFQIFNEYVSTLRRVS